jgi:hypothetical protein
MPKRHRTDTQPTHAEPEKRSLLESSIGVLAATGIFVVAVVAGRMLWDQIVVPYSNPWNIAGVLAQEHFNPKTNTHRFLMMVLIPTVLLLVAYIILRSRARRVVFPSVQIHDEAEPPQSRIRALTMVGYMIFAALCAMVTGIETVVPLDTHHEGTALAPAISLLHGQIPYKDTLFVHGWFQDPVSVITSFALFGRSIGAFRTFNSICCIIVFMILAWFVLKLCRGKFAYAFAMLFALTPLLYYYNGNVAYPVGTLPRELLPAVFLVGVAYLYNALTSDKPNLRGALIANGLCGLVSVLALLHSTDRGAYLMAIYVFTLVLALIASPNKSSFRLGILGSGAMGFGLGWLIVFLTLRGGFHEFMTFTFQVEPKAFVYAVGYEYPIDQADHFWVLVLLGGMMLWIVRRILGNLASGQARFMESIQHSAKEYFIELVLMAMSIVFFNSALGRADSQHVVYSFWPAALLALYILLRHYIMGRRSNALILKFLVPAGIVFTLGLLVYRAVTTDLLVAAFPLRIPDTMFLPDQEVATLDFFKQHPDDQFYTLTSQGSWFYFSDKPNPTRFTNLGDAAIPDYQKDLINDLDRKRVKYIIYSNSMWTMQLDGIPVSDRAPIVYDYVRSHYKFLQYLDDNEIWARNESP